MPSHAQDLAVKPAGAPVAAPRLRGKKLKFAEAWLRLNNVRLAAKEAGCAFGKEATEGFKLMQDPAVTAWISFQVTNKQHEIRVPRDNLRDDLAAIGRSNPMDAVELDDQGHVKRLRLDKLDGRDIKRLKYLPGRTKDDPPGVDIEFHAKEIGRASCRERV